MKKRQLKRRDFKASNLGFTVQHLMNHHHKLQQNINQQSGKIGEYNT